MQGANSGLPLGKIGLTDLTKPGWGIAHSAQNISYVPGKYVSTYKASENT